MPINIARASFVVDPKKLSKDDSQSERVPLVSVGSNSFTDTVSRVPRWAWAVAAVVLGIIVTVVVIIAASGSDSSPSPPPPSPPGSSYVQAVSFTTTVAGSIDTFDHSGYAQGLASVLSGVSASDIEMSISAGSVVVDSTIKTPEQSVQDSVMSTLSGYTAATLSTAIGMQVEAVQPPNTTQVSIYSSNSVGLPESCSSHSCLLYTSPSPRDS